MNFKISSSRLVAAALCAVLLVGCDSIKDVRDEPYTAVPPETGLIGGTITGLGSRRAMVMSWSGAGNLDCQIPDPGNPTSRLPAPCKFLGIEGESSQTFSFGSFDVGTAYNINVESQPYGKICTVANASGTVGSGSASPVVTCVNDTVNFPRYDLTVNIPAQFQTLPNMKITFESEDGRQVQNATGLASVTFPSVLFAAGANLPLFQYRVKATYQDSAGGELTPNYCSFTPISSTPPPIAFTSGGTNLDSAGGAVVPVGPLTVSVAACAFTATVAVVNEDSPASTAATGGLKLALRNHYTGVEEQTLDVANYTGQTGVFNYVSTTVAFGSPLKANANSLYELVITQQPAGMHCIAAGQSAVVADTQSPTQGVGTTINAPTSSAVALLDPAVLDWWAFADRQVRCKSVPVAPNILTGTYQMDAKTGTQTNGNMYGRPREFLTFFDDGTFLYGIGMDSASATNGSPNNSFQMSPTGAAGIVRGNYSASSGVANGFYTYNSAAGTIAFTVLTATNINPNGRGLNGMPGYTPAVLYIPQPPPVYLRSVLPRGLITATNVVKGANGGLGTLNMDFTGGNPSSTRHWSMTEPVSNPGEMGGAWVTADHQRVFVYDKTYTYVFHMGVNGYGNLQDTCILPLEDSTFSAGRYSLHSDSATSGTLFSSVPTCQPGLLNYRQVSGYAKTYDLPSALPANSTVPQISQAFVGPRPPTGLGPTTPRRPPNYHARFPGLTRQDDGRPSSPVEFEVTAGNPDTMTVQNTLNGIPIEDEIHVTKSVVN
jgi:hypothetical protein